MIWLGIYTGGACAVSLYSGFQLYENGEVKEHDWLETVLFILMWPVSVSALLGFLLRLGVEKSRAAASERRRARGLTE